MSSRPARFVIPLLVLVASGCVRTFDVTFPREPGGGAMTDSDACIYDFDRKGFWYVLFVHEEGLLEARHRHGAGHHLFLDSHGDFVFFSRCSGRGEVIDVMGRYFRLQNGQVLVSAVSDGKERVQQLPISLASFDGSDPEQRARILAELATRPEIQKLISPEAQARLIAQYSIEKKKKELKQ